MHLAVSAPADAVGEARETYQIHVDGEVLHIVLAGAGVQAVSEPAPSPPDLILRIDQAAFIDLSLGRTDLITLVTAQWAQVSGSKDSVARATWLFTTASHRPAPRPGRSTPAGPNLPESVRACHPLRLRHRAGGA